MVELLQFALLVIGITYLLTKSTILVFWRLLISTTLGKLPALGPMFMVLIYCPPCTSFWVGLALGHTILHGLMAMGLVALVTESLNLDVFSHEQAGMIAHDKTTEETNE